jgi:predicted regulator of Ras-like GTPase activity (Roadblock/LC7/MglB family)
MAKGQAAFVSIESLLEELVSGVDGATGAIVLESDGEAVRWYPENEAARLRLRGAYVAVVLRASRAAAASAGLGAVNCLVLEYEGSSFIVQEIDGDCVIALELGPSNNIGQGMFRLKPIVLKLRAEIAL